MVELLEFVRAVIVDALATVLAGLLLRALEAAKKKSREKRQTYHGKHFKRH